MKTNSPKAGFTIVELLIVVVVIAILAAITVVAFSGMQSRAREAAIKTSLTSVSKTLENDKTLNGVYPATLAEANQGQGLEKNQGYSYEYSTLNAGADYVLTISKDSTVFNYNSTDRQIKSGPASGHTGGAVSSTPTVVEYREVGKLAQSASVYDINTTTTLQPNDLLITIMSEYYALGDATVSIGGSVQTPIFSKNIGSGVRIVDVTKSTGLSGTATLQVKTDASYVHLAYYVIRGLDNPSTLSYQEKGWAGDDANMKPAGFVRSVPSAPIKAGQFGLFVASSYDPVTFPTQTTPALSEWTTDGTYSSTSLFMSAHVTPSTDGSIAGALRANSSNYLGGTIFVFGN